MGKNRELFLIKRQLRQGKEHLFVEQLQDVFQALFIRFGAQFPIGMDGWENPTRVGRNTMSISKEGIYKRGERAKGLSPIVTNTWTGIQDSR